MEFDIWKNAEVVKLYVRIRSVSSYSFSNKKKTHLCLQIVIQIADYVSIFISQFSFLHTSTVATIFITDAHSSVYRPD